MTSRPRPFAEDWTAQGTRRPPTTVANPLGAAGRVERPAVRSLSIGARFRHFEVDEIAAAPAVDTAGGLDLSPDGTEVVFAWDRPGDAQIFAAPLVGDRIIQLTGDGRRSIAPRWSPDGRQVAFLRDEGDGWLQIALVDRDGERARTFTSEPLDHSDLAWSPDGRWIAYVASAPGQRATLFLIDAGTGERRRLGDGQGDDSDPRWSPDGGRVLFSSRRDGRSDLFLTLPRGGAPSALAWRRGDEGSASQGLWSPDGSAIAFTIRTEGRGEIAVAHLREGAVALERFSATPFDDSDPVWRPDGRGLVYRHRRDADVSLRRAFTVSHADEAVADLPGTHFSAAVGRDSESVVAILDQARRPADVILRPRGGIEVQRITRSLPATVDPGALVEPMVVSFPGDGGGVDALLYLPHTEALVSARPAAVLLFRAGPLTRRWDPLAQLIANQGHAVLIAATRDEAVRGGEWLRREGLASAVTLYDEKAPPRESRADRIERHRTVLAWAEQLRRT